VKIIAGDAWKLFQFKRLLTRMLSVGL